MAPDCVGPEVEAMKPAPGEILLLENLRFHAEEEKNDPAFAQKLAALCDLYVNDAFGSAHRAHASTEGMIKYVSQAAAGLLMEQELKYLGMATTNPPRPCVAILGGAKVSDKIEVIQNLGKVVDRLVIGGAMAYTFLRAQGLPTGKSLVEEDKIELAKDLLAKLGDKLLLPVDHVVVSEIAAGAANEVVERFPTARSPSISGLRPSRNSPASSPAPRPSSGTVPWESSRSRHSTKAPWRWPKPWPNPEPSAWWAAAIPRRPSRPPVSPPKSRTFPPAAGRRSSSSPESNCPAWRRSTVNRVIAFGFASATISV